jgi:predicted methyltransferase
LPAEVAHFENDPVGRMRTLANKPGRDNVEVVSADLVAMPETMPPPSVRVPARPSLHRIEPASVREEVEAAGFVLEGETSKLANRDDPHSVNVFDSLVKGETDRFAYWFVKP